MLRHFLAALVVISLWLAETRGDSAAVPLSPAPPAEGAANLRLDPRIPPPDRSKYRHIRDARDWKNPFISVGRDHVTLSCRALSIQYKRVRLEDLARELVALPVSAWPYGRIVGASESGPRAVGDGPFIKENCKKLEKIIHSTGAVVDWWP
jgi:hypothetical protein